MGLWRGLDSIELMFSEVASVRRRSSLGFSQSAGPDTGIGFSVGDHILSMQTEPLPRVKEEAVTMAGQ